MKSRFLKGIQFRFLTIFMASILCATVTILIVQSLLLSFGRINSNELAKIEEDYAFLYFIAFLALTTIIFFVFSRFIIKRIERINNYVCEVKSGNFDAQIKDNSKDEIGELSNGINDMVNTIKWPALWIFKIGLIAYPADIDSVKPAVSIRLPFEEPVIVAWGGDTIKDNYHVWLPMERWAYDLFASPALLESQRLEDYGVYGMDVVAPISGYVVGAYDQEKEHGTGDVEAEKAESTCGNYVFIKIEETGTYLVLAHLKYDSVCVKEGDYVTEGSVIAKAGNSGSSSEPHLHIHHQRQDPNKQLLLAQGLPLYFRDTTGPALPKGGGDTRKNGIRVPNGETITPIK